MSLAARLPHGVAVLFAALGLSPDAVFATDRENRIVFWNRSAEQVLGYGEDEVVGLSCASLLQGCDVFGNRYCSESCPVAQMGARGEVIRHFDLHIRAKDGGDVALDVSILEIPTGEPGHFYLAHILKPPARTEQARVSHPAPRPALVTVRASADARVRRLTQREVEVLGMLAAGHGTPEIASRLHISNLTARNHIQNLLEKLEVHSKAEAVAFAFQKNLL